MMHIETYDFKSMIQSASTFLNVDIKKLSYILETISCKSQNGLDYNYNIANNEIDSFVQTNLPNIEINEVPFFHLTRRLNNDYTNMSLNLFELLTQKNPMTIFLYEHGITFTSINDHLEIYKNGVLTSLEDTSRPHVCYLRKRLGYTRTKDFCCNGFAFHDQLYKNSYAHSLYHGPEIITQLACFLKDPSIQKDFFDNSTFYCVEFNVPLNLVLFDTNENFSKEEKKFHFTSQLLKRLLEYIITDIEHTSDHSNPMLRLPDNKNMSNSYFVKKEIITRDLLR